MPINIKTPSVAISASTSTATSALPASSAKYIYVSNGSATSGAYVNAGATGVTATSANIMVPPFGWAIFERDPVTDVAVAALLISGTAIVSFTPCSQEF